jgi:chromosome segregation ATPase
MTDAVDALRKRLAEVESRHEEFQRRHTAIQAEYEKLVIQLRGKQDLEVEIKTKDEQIKKLKSQITAEKFTPASQAEIEKAQDALQRAIKAENDLKQIKLSKDKAISRLQQENGDLEKKLEHQESKIETMGKKIEDMTQAKEELTLKQTQYVDPEVENENIRLRDENYELDKQLKEEQKRREDAEQLAAELKMKLERQQPTFIPAPPTVHADEGDDDALESAVRKYEEDLAKAEGELNSVRQELDGVNTEIDQEEISMSSANVQGETAETEEAEEDASDKPVETVETELSGTAARNETTPTADLAFLVPDAVPEQQPRTSSKRGGDDAFPPLARSKPAPQSSNEAKKMKVRYPNHLPSSCFYHH